MSENETFIAPCPCGETPARLCLSADHGSPKWAQVSGSCCGAWEVEFRAGNRPLGSAEVRAAARVAWNAAPRAQKRRVGE